MCEIVDFPSTYITNNNFSYRLGGPTGIPPNGLRRGRLLYLWEWGRGRRRTEADGRSSNSTRSREEGRDENATAHDLLHSRKIKLYNTMEVPKSF